MRCSALAGERQVVMLMKSLTYVILALMACGPSTAERRLGQHAVHVIASADTGYLVPLIRDWSRHDGPFTPFIASPARAWLSREQLERLSTLLLEESGRTKKDVSTGDDYRDLQIGIGLTSGQDSTFLACDFLNDMISSFDGRVPVGQYAMTSVRSGLLAILGGVAPSFIERPTTVVGEWWRPEVTLRLHPDGSGEREIRFAAETITRQLQYEEQPSRDSLLVVAVQETPPWTDSYKCSILFVRGGRMKLSWRSELRSTRGLRVETTESGWAVFCRVK